MITQRDKGRETELELLQSLLVLDHLEFLFVLKILKCKDFYLFSKKYINVIKKYELPFFHFRC